MATSIIPRFPINYYNEFYHDNQKTLPVKENTAYLISVTWLGGGVATGGKTITMATGNSGKSAFFTDTLTGITLTCNDSQNLTISVNSSVWVYLTIIGP